MKTKSLLLLSIILSLCIIQIKSKDIDTTIKEFNPFNKNKSERCMEKIDINRTGEGEGTQDHCIICRADKDDYGFNISSSDAQTGEDAKGTYALRPKEKQENAQLICQEKLNEDQAKEKHDQENRIPRCEIYDHYGLCVRCMIGYGLQWDTSAVGTGEQTGAYKCIDNQYRTPYCHKYNSSNQCIECKWNQDPEQKNIYTNHMYKLDFALYNTDKKIYCINNEKIDPQLEKNESEKFELTDNCASYGSDKKCNRCHTRKFNLEGIKQYIDIDTAQDETYKKPILDFHLNQQDEPVCETLPSWFVTDPSQLIKWSYPLTTINEENYKCKTGKFLEAKNSKYGCGTSVSNCDTYNFDWDVDYFEKEGVWVNKITGCHKCANGFILNTSEQTCIKTENDYQNCSEADANGCTGCNNDNITTGDKFYIQKKQIGGSLKNVCKTQTTSAKIKDCMTYHYDEKDIRRCTRCNPGYVIKDNGKDQNDKIIDDSCQKISQYIEILNTDGTSQNPNQYQLYERGCLKIDKSNKCLLNGGYGYTKLTNNVQSGSCRYGLMQDQMLCKTDDSEIEKNNQILGCEEYVTVYEETRCIKCQKDYFINYSGSRCLIKSESTDITVPNCEIQDGPWCQRCKRDKTNSVYYELTQYNTCVKITEDDKECIYRNYNIVSNQLSPGDCLLCNDKYKLNNSKKCEILDQYKAEQDKISLFIIDKVNGQKGWELVDKKYEVEKCRIYIKEEEDSNEVYNCFECDRQDNKLYGIELNNQDKYECTECESNQILKEKLGRIQCVDKDEISTQDFDNNCLKTGECGMCEFGYEVDDILTGKQCKEQISYGCTKVDYSVEEKCLNCQHPFFDIGGKCQLFIPNCIKMSGNKCSQCDPGYEEYQNKCYLKSDLCKTQDWEKSKDPNSNTLRAHVCETCFNINGNDNIRLFWNKDKLAQGCMSGCQDQKLYRNMKDRSDNNPFNLWKCDECRNDHYHFLNTENRKNCQPAQVITNCAYYVNETTDGTSKCRECEQEYSLEEQGTECKTCQEVIGCIEYDYTQPGVGEVNNKKCACKTCGSGSLQNNECTGTNQTSLPNCKVEASSTECKECNDEFFLNAGKKCQENTAQNCSNKSKTANECQTCSQNHEKNESKVCVLMTDIDNCKTHESKTLCLECDTDYGLNYDKTKCLKNSEEYRSEKCLQYSENYVTQDNIKYPVCIKCYDDYALDYDHKYLSRQCIQAKLCQRARLNQNTDDTSNDYINIEQKCLECLKVDRDGKQVFRTKKDSTGECKLEENNKIENNYIANCRVYNDFTNNKSCYDCHEGYSPDSDGTDENNSNICVSDYHPGSLPGCKFYDKAIDNINEENWLKYEWLKCKTCEIEWRFHSASSEIPKKRYNANTYTRDCDVVEQVNLAAIAPNVWTGKDGGLRSSQTTGDDDDDGPVIIPDDREQYEDPIVFANILSFSAILIFAIVSVL